MYCNDIFLRLKKRTAMSTLQSDFFRTTISIKRITNDVHVVTTPANRVQHCGYCSSSGVASGCCCACVRGVSLRPARTVCAASCHSLSASQTCGVQCLCPSWRLAFVTFGLLREFLAFLPTLLYSTTPLGLFGRSALFCVSGRGHQRLATSPVCPSCLKQ